MSDSLREALDIGVFWEYRNVLLRGLAVNFYVFIAAAAVALGVGLAAALLRVNRFRLVPLDRHAARRDLPQRARLRHGRLGALRAAASDRLPAAAPVRVQSIRVRRHRARLRLQRLLRGNLPRRHRGDPHGHIDAARSCGMSERLILWRIVLPQVVRRMLPESINQFISLFKATTIVSLIAVPDLMYQVSMITQQEMRPLPLYTGAALTYFVVILLASSALRALAERWRTKIYA